MDRIEAKLTPSVVVIVDDDAARASLVGGALRSWFGTSVVQVRTWREQLSEQSPVLADLVILTPNLQVGDSPDPVAATLAQLSHVPTIVLAAACESQRAVNAVLDGASDAMVMEPSYLERLPARIRRTLSRERFQNVGDRRDTVITESLRRSKQENKRLRDRLGHVQTAAMLDPLTGLGNRRLFDQRLAQLWEIAQAADSELSCLLIDIDNFKSVNDTAGHAAGDRLLVLTAKVLLDQCRQDDVATRTGGDEFVVLLHGASAEQAQQVANRIRTQFEKETRELLSASAQSVERTIDPRCGGKRVTLHTTRSRAMATISVGGASRKLNRPSNAQDLVEQADEAMYAAKRAGKNRVELCIRSGASGVRWAAAG
ncbi:MAG: diguanylate cyclase [Pyrinomonadaceae bacterium]|nr:diguanylate cyclase [Phycisphaerales bacterium]